MTHPRAARYWIEVFSCGACGLLFLATLAWRDWIELVLGVDPDRGSGLLEWALTAVTAFGAIAFAATARRERRAGGSERRGRLADA